MKIISQAIIFILFFSSTAINVNGGNDSSITAIKCENRIDPVGVDTKDFKFSWILASGGRNQVQTAYHIMVATSADLLAKGLPDIWNSGKVESSENIQVKYKGRKLAPGTIYYWKVRSWDKDNGQSAWSTTGRFITALDTESDWQQAKWIGYTNLPDSMIISQGLEVKNIGPKVKKMGRTIIPLFRYQFDLAKTIKTALIFVCGLGQYELHINGISISENFLTPGWTDYDKTCLYNTYDVTPEIHTGQNTIGIIVGNGFYYINTEGYNKFIIAQGAPKVRCILKLTFTDGTDTAIVTNNKWKTSPSPISYSSIYGGEYYDAQKEQAGWDTGNFIDSTWNEVVMADAPEGNMQPETDYPLREMQEFTPVKITQPNKDFYVYDFGQNASGIAEVTVKGKKGQTVLLYPSENLTRYGLANQRPSGSPYLWSYTLRSDGPETWKPKFTYYGFRYIQVVNAVPDTSVYINDKARIVALTMIHTRNSSPECGTFQCSNDLLNKIDTLIGWSIKSNLASIVTDCPHREKLGWLEQTYLMGGAIHYSFDVYLLLRKIIDDIIDAQANDNLIPCIAPEFVRLVPDFRDSPEWGSAAIILSWLVYKWYGDSSVILRSYKTMNRYLEYLNRHTENDLLTYGIGDWLDIGKKPPGKPQLTPKALTSSAIYYYDLVLMSQMARIAGHTEDTMRYGARASKVMTAFNKAFYKDSLHIFAEGSQTAMAMPLYCGIVDDSLRDKILGNLLDSINRKRQITTGDIGFYFLLKALESGNRSQVIFDLITRDSVPGYVQQIKNGATSLSESWNGGAKFSSNHLMLGHALEWFYSSLAGISQTDSSVAYKVIRIAPQPVRGVSWAKGSYDSPYGKIVSDWSINKNQFVMNVEIPVNTNAEIVLPAKKIRKVHESGKRIRESGGFKVLDTQGDKVRLRLGSGKYSFSVRGFKLN